MKRYAWNLVVLLVGAANTFAQVSVEEHSLSGGTDSRVDIHVETMDRSFVPLRIATSEKPVGNGGTVTESVTQVRLSDGTYFEAGKATTTTQPAGEGVTRAVSEVTTTDRQGAQRTSSQVVTTSTKRGDTQSTTSLESRRTASGNLVPSRRVEETTVSKNDGYKVTQRVVQEADVNGQMQIARKVQETTSSKSANETVTESVISGDQHLTGGFGEIARETTVVRQENANTTRSERTIREPRAGSWEVTARVVTAEFKTDRGTARETIKYAKPMHSGNSPTSSEPLSPKLKVVERMTIDGDGRKITEREVFFYGVNNEWKPQNFSTSYGGSADTSHGK